MTSNITTRPMKMTVCAISTELGQPYQQPRHTGWRGTLGCSIAFYLAVGATPAYSDLFLCYQNGQFSTRNQPAAGCSRMLYTNDKSTPATTEPKPEPASNSVAIVQHVQKSLLEKGYAPGPPDGVMGKKTREAIRRYQSDQGLEITGKIEQVLLESLQIEF